MGVPWPSPHAEDGGVLHLSTPVVFSLSSSRGLPCQGLFLSSKAMADTSPGVFKKRTEEEGEG